MNHEPRPTLRRLSLLEMLDKAMHLTRRSFKQIFPWTALPFAAAASVITLGQLLTMPYGGTSGDVASINELHFTLMMVVTFAAVILYIIMFALCSTVALVATTKVVRGDELSMAECWRWTLERAAAGTVLLYWLGVGIGSFCCLVPGIAVWTVLGLTVPIMVAEGLRGTAAFRRSSDLIMSSPDEGFGRHPAVRLLGIGLVGYLLTYAVTFAVQLPLGAIQIYLGFRSIAKMNPAGQDLPPAWFWLQSVQAILGACATIAALIYVMFAIALLYLDVRSARSGGDLHAALDELGAPAMFEPTLPRGP